MTIDGRSFTAECRYQGTSDRVDYVIYTSDLGGRLTSRRDHAVDLSETYQYDVLSRLTESRVSGAGAALYAFAGFDTVSYEYDATGNLLYRSDVGVYGYGDGAGPHAVTRIERGDGTATAFGYDANGSMTSGDGKIITWTSFDKPATIDGGGRSELHYGPERQLVRQVDGEGGTTRVTYHIGGLYEHIVSEAGETSRFNITYQGGVIAVIENTAAEVPVTHYLHSDRLGSLVAVSDEYGFVVDRYRYDPFGERRIAVYDGAAGDAGNLVAITSRGFTGHRELAAVGLVHMGGRVYHPGIGRFLSADPYIQSPLSSQSYNRYSYLWNSPVNGTDPSGYFSYNPDIPRHLSGVEVWTYIQSNAFNKPAPSNVSYSLGQVKAHREAKAASANLLIQAELPHINRNFSRDELYAIGTGKLDIGLTAAAQKRINGVINQAWQWDGLAREMKKAGKWYRKYGGAIITGALVMMGVPPNIASAVGQVAGARMNGASTKDALKAAGKGYIIGNAYAATGGMLDAGIIGTGGAVAMHAVIGGINADWNGGSFSDGALAGAVGKFVTIRVEAAGIGLRGQFAATVVSAGIVAEINGGDFGDAALTAAYGFFLNQLATSVRSRDIAQKEKDAPVIYGPPRPRPDTFYNHGNYAGPGHYGEDLYPNPAHSPYDPIDSIDVAARRHDISYFNYGIDWTPGHSNPVRLEIDRQFLKELNSINPQTLLPKQFNYIQGANYLFGDHVYQDLGIYPYVP